MSDFLPKKYINYNKCFTNKKYIYINIPKNGSTSLRGVLGVKQDIFTHKDNKIVFTVFRNPIDRVISSFFECSKLRSDGPKNITIKTKWYKLFKTDIVKSFEMFIDFLSQKIEGDYYFYDAHTHPQYLFLEKKGLKIDDLDYVFLLEKLDSLFETLNLVKPKSKANKNKNILGINKIKESIVNNEKLLNKIKSLYEKDFIIYEKIKNRK